MGLKQSKVFSQQKRGYGAATKKVVRRYGRHLPLGELAGETITRKMLKSRGGVSPKILDFLQFCELVNGGQIR